MWLPEIIRRSPSTPLVLRWITIAEDAPAEAEAAVAEAIAHFGTRQVASHSDRWELLLPWQTLVYGLVRREVDEQVTLELVHDPKGCELRVSCLPVETHAAHAAGAGGVALFAVAVWLIAGWTAGILPALATALAGGLWTDWVRVVAMQRLEQRLRDLTESVGLTLWPETPATLLPPPTRPRI